MSQATFKSKFHRILGHLELKKDLTFFNILQVTLKMRENLCLKSDGTAVLGKAP